MSHDLHIPITAITRLVELAEWELACPACPDPPEKFHSDLREATQDARRFLNEVRPPAGPFFISAGYRKRQVTN